MIHAYLQQMTPISTYSEKMIEFDLGLQRDFKCPANIADITHPIIGADFSAHYGLLLDIKNRWLIDSQTNLSTRGVIQKTNIFSISTYDQNTNFAKLLSQFPGIIQLPALKLEPR